MAQLQRAKELLQTLEITKASVEGIVAEWEKSPPTDDDPHSETLPSQELFESTRRLLAASGKFVELTADPSYRLTQLTSQYFEARCLHTLVSMQVPNILATAGDDGMDIEELSAKSGIEARKLSHLLRCLTATGVFKETANNKFANNRISAALVNNEPLRALLMIYSDIFYTASDRMPRVLLDEKTGPSHSLQDCAFTKATGDKDCWKWLEEGQTIRSLIEGEPHYPGPFGVEVKELIKSAGDDLDKKVPRPELNMFGLAMVGQGKITSRAQPYDYPWQSLGKATFVDVGGGLGGFCQQLSKLYPDLSFIVQDRPAIAEAAKEAWSRNCAAEVEKGRIEFQGHDFFKENPVKGASVYWLRNILHDWPDEDAVQILINLRKSMTSNSRLLICEQVLSSTIGCPELPRAPEPLPANYGYYSRYGHCLDIGMLVFGNARERNAAEWKELGEKAGLVLRKICPCRSLSSVVEFTLAQE